MRQANAICALSATAVSVKIISCDIYAEMRSADCTAVAPAGHEGCHIAKRGGIESCGSQQHCQPGTGPLARLAIGFASAALFWRTQAMARFVVSPVLVAMLALIAVPWGAAWAQERATCSQARRPLRHPASLPKAVRQLHANRLLDGRVGEAMRVREA